MSCQDSSELLPACNSSCRIGGRFLFSASNSLKSYLPCFRQHSVINFFSMYFCSCRIKYGPSFYLSLMGPMMATLICNAVIFCAVVRKLSQRKTGTTNRSQTKDRNRRLKVSISLAVILGLNWFVGLLLLENANTALQWIFTILVSSQGFAIFIAQVLVHRQVKSFASSKISSSSSATGTSRLRSSSATSTLLSNFLLNFRRSSSVQSDPADILAMKHSRMGINLSHTYEGSSPSLAGSWASGDVLMFSSDFKTTRGGDAYSQSARSSRWGSANPSLASASEFESDLSEAVGEFLTVQMAYGQSLDCRHSQDETTNQLTTFNEQEKLSIQKNSSVDSSLQTPSTKSSGRRHSVDSYNSGDELSALPMLSAAEQTRCRDSRSNSLESGRSLSLSKSNPANRRRSSDPQAFAGEQPKLSYAARARLKREERQAAQNGRVNSTKKNSTTQQQRENDILPEETKRRSTLPASFAGELSTALSEWSQPVHKSSSFKSWFGSKRRKSKPPQPSDDIINASTAPPVISVIPEEDEVVCERNERRVEKESYLSKNPSPETTEEGISGSQVAIEISVTEY